MKAYPAYKASGIEWLGEIPAHWEVKKLKYCDEVIMGQSPNSEDYQLEPDGLPFLQGNADFTQLYPKPRIWCNTANKIAETDDILLSVRAPIGAVNIADQRYGIGRGLCAIRSIKTDKKYLYYIALCLSDELNSIGTGSTFTAVSVDEIRNLTISQPRSLEEQRAIAAYLDRKTRLIDTYIAKKQQQVERWQAYRAALINQTVTKGLNPDAPMKASGIEWLGDIPAHWEVKRIKNIVEVISKGTTPSTLGGDISDIGKIRFIKAENIANNRLSCLPEFFIDDKTNDLLKRSELQENDILFVIAGATLGKVAILTKDYLPANTNQAVCFIRLNQMGHVKFTWYWLQSNMIIGLTWLDAVQSAQPNLSMGRLGNFNIPYPPIDEQHAIAAYLDEQTAKIDTLAAATQRQLARLRAYRTALISEVVTGKLDVRGELMVNQ